MTTLIRSVLWPLLFYSLMKSIILLQFDDDHAALVMSWVPRKLAPSVRCVFSMINDTPQHRTLMARESKPHELHMVPLDLNSRKVNTHLYNWSYILMVQKPTSFEIN